MTTHCPGIPTPPDSAAGTGHGDAGQATTEYALILLAAAFIGLIVVAWATSGGGTEMVGRLFDRVMRAVVEQT